MCLLNYSLTKEPVFVSGSGGSQIFSEWRQDVSMSGLDPPFDTAFYNVRMSVTTDLHEIIKTVSIIFQSICLIILNKKYIKR